MEVVTDLEPRHVTAKMNYYLPASRGGHDAFHAGTVGDKRKKRDTHAMPISDIRGREHEFTMDKQGFQLVKFESSEKTFDDDERIQERYHPECEDLIRKATGCSKVVVVNHTVRRRSWEEAMEAEKGYEDDARSAYPSTAPFVHIDQSETGAIDFANHRIPEHVNKHRWAIVNLWKPITPVTRDALAVCDIRTVAPEDRIEIPLVFPSKTLAQDGVQQTTPNRDPYVSACGNRPPAHIWMLWHSDRHKWYYASHMQPNEALLLKMNDTKEGVGKNVPHSSFSCDKDYGPSRQSLEVRMILVWEDELQEEAKPRL